MTKYTDEQVAKQASVLRRYGEIDIANMLEAFADLLRERESGQTSGLVYVPGMWRCAKCDFVLLQSNLNAATGAVTPRDKPGDACPNCATALWRVTYRDAYADVMKLFEDHIASERESAPVVPDEMPHWLLGRVIDDVFDGAIEDASVIEDIYRSIVSNLRRNAQINSMEPKP